MIVIRSPADISKARLPPHLDQLVNKHLRAILSVHQQYNPDEDGFLALVTSTDTDVNMGDRLGQKWRDGCFEGTSYDTASRCFVTMILRNNQFAISILIPDEPWLDPGIRDRMKSETA